MSSEKFGWRAAIFRIVGASTFVVLSLPFGPIPSAQGLSGVPVSLKILGGILILSTHAYLASRAWYALHTKGLLISAIAIVCLEAFMFSSGTFNISYLHIFYISISSYLSLIYSFGLIYNHIDSKLSGLVHSKAVH